MIKYQKNQNKIAVLTIDRTDKPMNVMDGLFVEQFEAAFDRAISEQVRGVVIASSHPEFIAGADLGMLQTVKTLEDSMKLTGGILGLFRKIETAGFPVVAALNGTTLGGGYELALACHYRVALDHPKSQIGLPEVTLGLLPGGGGTQRLPRLIGFEKALPFLLEGKKVNPQKALKAGLVDALATSEEKLHTKAITYILENSNATRPWDEKKFRVPGGEVQSPKGYQVFAAAASMLREKTHNNYPAPAAILSCVYEGLQLPFDQGLEIESRYFASLMTGSVAKSMIRSLFFGINACNKGAARPKDVEKRKVTKVGVLGAGMMGSGIAFITAKAGIPVILKDVSVEAAEKGKSYSAKVMDKLIAKGRAQAEDKEKVLHLIRATDDPNAVEGCDLVIETVFEDRNVKAMVTQESEKVLTDNAIVASNTSTIPITKLAEASKHPQNFIGLHFFSPVDRMPLIEIIRGQQTSDEALALCIDYAQQVRKTPIVVNDAWGFYTSRVFMTYVEEGIFCLRDGVPAALVENAGKALGMPVGPLAVADEVSLDLVHHILAQAKLELGENAIDAGLDETVNLFVKKLKRLGRKSGGGFYEYPSDGKKHLWSGLQEYFPLKEGHPELETVKQRMMLRQVLETVRCFEEGVLTTARDADVGAILGWGFPAWAGGPLSYVDTVGAKQVVEAAKQLHANCGDRFAVPALLEKMVQEGQLFYP